jgi:hypothetical protein
VAGSAGWLLGSTVFRRLCWTPAYVELMGPTPAPLPSSGPGLRACGRKKPRTFFGCAPKKSFALALGLARLRARKNFQPTPKNLRIDGRELSRAGYNQASEESWAVNELLQHFCRVKRERRTSQLPLWRRIASAARPHGIGRTECGLVLPRAEPWAGSNFSSSRSSLAPFDDIRPPRAYRKT